MLNMQSYYRAELTDSSFESIKSSMLEIKSEELIFYIVHVAFQQKPKDSNIQPKRVIHDILVPEWVL